MTTDPKIFTNGTILTMDDSNSVAEAIGVVGDRILAVGSNGEVQAQMPKNSQEINLQGQTMIPAFIDPHGHFPDSGFVSEL